MADWDDPTIGSLNTGIIDEIKARDVDAATLHEDNTATNVPDKSKRWNNATKVFQRWISGAWANLVLAIAGGGTGATTAAGARTALSVDSSAEVTTKVNTHAALTNPHSATAAATASRIILRDASSRAKVADPSAATDIANKQWVEAQIPSGTIPAGEIILFDKDTAVTGWTLLTDVNDKLVFVTKGSAASGQTGGANHSTGTWTQPDHTHTGPSHTHTGPSHTHAAGTYASPNHTHTLAYGTALGKVDAVHYIAVDAGVLKAADQNPGSGAIDTLGVLTPTTGNPSATAVTGTSAAGGTGNTGAAGTGATGGEATANTWRPAARNFTRQQKD